MTGPRSLMSKGRRYLAAAILAMLLVPSLGMVIAPYERQSVLERRTLAPRPALPADDKGWALLPRRIDGWFSDHFAWRGTLVKAGFTLQAAAGLRSSGNLQVLRGKGDWLLLDAGLLGLTGADARADVAKRYAGFVCALQGEVQARGARFLFAPAPSTAEAYPEALPDWIPRRAPPQPDLVLAATRACGVCLLVLCLALRAVFFCVCFFLFFLFFFFVSFNSLTSPVIFC